MKAIVFLHSIIERITGQQPSAATSQTETEHIADVCANGSAVATPSRQDVIPNQNKAEQQGIEVMRFAFAGENERYIKVKVQGKTYQLAKSRVTYILNGSEVVVTMSIKYAASRKELVGLQ